MRVDLPLAPLYLLAGAPGSGKTTLLPHLCGHRSGLVVIDMDELLEDGALLGVPIADPRAAPVWPAYNRMWRRIVTLVRRAGHAVLLLCPVPSLEDLTEGAAWDPPTRWALLDCDDELRRDRLRARGYPQDWVDDALEDAAQARALIPHVISSDADEPAAVAAKVLAWATAGASRGRRDRVPDADRSRGGARREDFLPYGSHHADP
jgi:hypothetical protein